MSTKKRRHPVTGDELSLKESVAWSAQKVLRHPAFPIVFTLFSIIWWFNPGMFGDDAGLGHWNVMASWMAIAVEWTVGAAMFGQTGRDAVILRKLEQLEKSSIDVQSNDFAVDREVKYLVEQIARHLEIIP